MLKKTVILILVFISCQQSKAQDESDFKRTFQRPAQYNGICNSIVKSKETNFRC